MFRNDRVFEGRSSKKTLPITVSQEPNFRGAIFQKTLPINGSQKPSFPKQGVIVISWQDHQAIKLLNAFNLIGSYFRIHIIEIFLSELEGR